MYSVKFVRVSKLYVWYIATKTDYLSMTMGTRFAYVFVPFDNRLPSVSSTLQHFSNNKTKNIKK